MLSAVSSSHTFSPLASHQLLNPAIHSLASRLDLPSLPIHFNSILYSTLACFALQTASHHLISPRLFPRHYPALSPSTQFNWNTRVVAWAHAFYATGIAIWILTHYDRYRSIHDEKLFGYDRQAMDFLSISAGYFLWDVIVSLRMSAAGQGFGFLLHAISCFVAFTYSIKPFCGYFGFMFLLWEASTIFLNPHWFFDKVGMSGSKTQIYNGVALLAMFFLSRLVLGNYTSYQLFTLALKPGVSERVGPTMVNTILVLDVFLSGLNLYWFYQMIESVRKRINSSPSKNNRRNKKKTNQKKQN